MTDREQILVAQALAFSILALEHLPDDCRPDNNIQDMERWRDVAQGQANTWA